jgi:hypothetical protein
VVRSSTGGVKGILQIAPAAKKRFERSQHHDGKVVVDRFCTAREDNGSGVCGRNEGV